jgi:SAM-dependent methyltransferase
MTPSAEFDQFADEYEVDLNQALAATGEGQDYFARGRVNFLAGCLRRLGQAPQSAMDYGCGIGGTAALLREIVGVLRVVGLDISERSLERAQREYGGDTVGFQTFERYEPAADLDLAYCNGVFHHIPVEDRGPAIRYIYRSLRPGGLFAFWENNPWNPGTRYVMAKCAFDRNAVPLTPPLAKRLLREAGFEMVRTDFLFYFPRALQPLRFLESLLHWLPLGGQYQILCQKPGAARHASDNSRDGKASSRMR